MAVFTQVVLQQALCQNMRSPAAIGTALTADLNQFYTQVCSGSVVSVVVYRCA